MAGGGLARVQDLSALRLDDSANTVPAFPKYRVFSV